MLLNACFGCYVYNLLILFFVHHHRKLCLSCTKSIWKSCRHLMVCVPLLSFPPSIRLLSVYWTFVKIIGVGSEKWGGPNEITF